MSGKKNIVITFSYYGIGGAQRRAVNLANEFVKNGYNVEILAVLGEDGSIKKGENYFNVNEKIDVISIPDYFSTHKNDSFVKNFLDKNRQKIKKLKRAQYILKNVNPISNYITSAVKGMRRSEELKSFLISREGATIISFGFNIFEKVYWATKGLDFKLIYAETNASDKYINDANYNATKKVIEKANAWVFQTQEQRKFFNFDGRDNAIVINNPIKSDLPDIYIGEKKNVIVNFCRLSPQKNLMLLVKAFEKFYAHNQEYSLHIYADTPNPKFKYIGDELCEYISAHKLADSVFVLPPTSDIHNVIKDCAMFVSSSDYEGISNSMIEAMAMGLPCVCTDCRGGGAREMITDGENGLLVPVGDADALSEAMHRMANEDGLSESCGKNASLIRETLSIEKIARQWLEVVDSVN